jgi:hypothetical protein
MLMIDSAVVTGFVVLAVVALIAIGVATVLR